MSEQAPLPPEVGTDMPRKQSDYVEIELPVGNQQPVIIQQSSGNCLWACFGMLGVILLVLGLIAGTLFFGIKTVFDGFTNFFNLPSVNVTIGEPLISNNVYIPSVERVQTLSELTTTRYNYADVTAGEVEMPQWLSILYGDSAVLVVVGTIEAGIDVSQITEENIVYDELNKILSIRLPAPALQTCFLDENQSYVVSRNTAIFADSMNNLEDELRNRALVYFRDTAIEEGILVEAENDARAALTDLLTILVNDETVTINIIFEDAPIEPVLPPSCVG